MNSEARRAAIFENAGLLKFEKKIVSNFIDSTVKLCVYVYIEPSTYALLQTYISNFVYPKSVPANLNKFVYIKSAPPTLKIFVYLKSASANLENICVPKIGFRGNKIEKKMITATTWSNPDEADVYFFKFFFQNIGKIAIYRPVAR